MLQSLNEWTANSDGGNDTDVIFIEFCKAFDKVPHVKLLCSLDMVGVPPQITDWDRVLLSDRVFIVVVQDSPLEEKD